MHRKKNSVRIIAGKWRSRKIIFPDNLELRPTPDRVRETVFNWLANYLHNTDCLDLFAGSAILSFEALSRGANRVVAVEKDSTAMSCIKENRVSLKADNLEIILADAIRFLQTSRDKFDIIFLDPPYKTNLLLEVIGILKGNDILKNNGFIYTEWDKPIDPQILPQNWEIIKAKKAGNIHYYLIKKL